MRRQFLVSAVVLLCLLLVGAGLAATVEAAKHKPPGGGGGGRPTVSFPWLLAFEDAATLDYVVRWTTSPDDARNTFQYRRWNSEVWTVVFQNSWRTEGIVPYSDVVPCDLYVWQVIATASGYTNGVRTGSWVTGPC